jgi:hypothetical protein
MRFPNEWGLKPYRFSFTAQGKRHVWVRFYHDIHRALEDCKRIALNEYPLCAHGFLIESDQDDEQIRKSWGLT